MLGGGAVCFHVVDTGPGIPAELHETVFEKFRQAHGRISYEHAAIVGSPVRPKAPDSCCDADDNSVGYAFAPPPPGPMHNTPPTPSCPPTLSRPLSTWVAAWLAGTVLATALVLGLVTERFARQHEFTRARAALAHSAAQLRGHFARDPAALPPDGTAPGLAELAHNGIEVFVLRADGQVLLAPAGSRESRMDIAALRAAAAADPGWFGPAPSLSAVLAVPGRDPDATALVLVLRQPAALALAGHETLRSQLMTAALLLAVGMAWAGPGLAFRVVHPLLQVMRSMALAQPQAPRLHGSAYAEAHDLAGSLERLLVRERREADMLRELNAELTQRLARNTAELQQARDAARHAVASGSAVDSSETSAWPA